MTDAADRRIMDLRGLRCPLPVLKVRKALAGAGGGTLLSVLADDPLAGVDIPNLLRESGDELVSTEREGRTVRFTIRRRGAVPTGAP